MLRVVIIASCAHAVGLPLQFEVNDAFQSLWSLNGKFLKLFPSMVDFSATAAGRESTGRGGACRGEEQKSLDREGGVKHDSTWPWCLTFKSCTLTENCTAGKTGFLQTKGYFPVKYLT